MRVVRCNSSTPTLRSSCRIACDSGGCDIRRRSAARRRWDQASPAARARGHAGNRRLHARWQAFDERHKRVTVANAAIARELAGWCWSLAVLDD